MFDPRQFRSMIKTSYNEKAKEFLRKNKINMNLQPYRYKDNRLVYWITIYRDCLDNSKNSYNKIPPMEFEFVTSIIDTQKNQYPSFYDILACVTKHDPKSLKIFCSEFGYDPDSREAKKTYLAVKNEWKQVKQFFAEGELAELREIN